MADRKGKRKNYDQESLVGAVLEVRENKMTTRQASLFYGVPIRTIQRHVKGQVENFNKPGIDNMLSDEEEQALVEYALYMSRRNLPLRRKDLRVTIVDLIRKSGPDRVLTCKFNLTKGPSNEWFRKLEERHPELKYSKPETLERARDGQSNEYVVDHYFNTLESLLKSLGLENKPGQVYNCDETGIDGKTSTTQKHYGVKGEKLYQKQMMPNIDHVTAMMAVSGSGKVLPTFLIFGKSWPSISCVDKIPKTWLYSSTESGFINKDLFSNWFRNLFIPHCGVDRPILLVLDNHESHVSLEVLELAKQNQIEILGLPAHCTHLFQPLDVGIFSHIKAKFREICLLGGLVNTKAMITKSTLALTWQNAITQGATSSVVKSAFRRTGLVPFDPTAIDMSKVKEQKVINLQSIATTSNSTSTITKVSSNPSSKVKTDNATVVSVDISSLGQKCSQCHQYLHPVDTVRQLPPELQTSFAIPKLENTEGAKKRRIGVPLERVLTGDEVMTIIKEKEQRIEKETEEKNKRKEQRERKKVEKSKDLCAKCGNKFPPCKGKGKKKGTKKMVDWVGCDSCQAWYHCICVNVELSTLGDHYECTFCEDANV